MVGKGRAAGKHRARLGRAPSSRFWIHGPWLTALLLAAFGACSACDSDDDSHDTGASGSGAGGTTSDAGALPGGSSNAGTGASNGGTTAGTGGGIPNGSSRLPAPPGDAVAKPSGAPGGLKVLDWAGFAAALSYTFDDSLPSQVAHYPELQATGVRMTFYLISSSNATSSTWARAVADGHELGNHTAHHCHQDGSGCSSGAWAGSLEAELDECTAHLVEEFGLAGVYTSASPYGDGAFGTAAQGSLFLNRGVSSGQIGANDATNPFQLPCHAAVEGEQADALNLAIDSARASKKWQIMLIHSLGGDGGYAPIDVLELLASIEHAQSAEDVWIDSVVNVGAYWRAQKLFASLTPTTEGDVETWTWTLPEHFPPGKSLRVTVDGGTVEQDGVPLSWDEHGYYEIALDRGSLTLSP